MTTGPISFFERAFRCAKWCVFRIICLGNRTFYFEFKARAMLLSAKLGLYEGRNVRLLSSLVREGDVAFDVGANFGVYTHELSRLVGNSGRVLAFEPLPFVFKTLNRIHNKLPNATFINSALSDHESDGEKIFIPKVAGGIPEPALASLTRSNISDESMTIKVEMLDRYLDGLTSLRFIKADVEGHEKKFLSGARATIEKFRPIIQFEINDIVKDFPVYQKMCGEMAYGMYIANRDLKLSRLTEAPDEAGFNFYLLPEELSLSCKVGGTYG